MRYKTGNEIYLKKICIKYCISTDLCYICVLNFTLTPTPNGKIFWHLRSHVHFTCYCPFLNPYLTTPHLVDLGTLGFGYQVYDLVLDPHGEPTRLVETSQKMEIHPRTKGLIDLFFYPEHKRTKLETPVSQVNPFQFYTFSSPSVNSGIKKK